MTTRPSAPRDGHHGSEVLPPGVEERLARLEARAGALTGEVRTHRLVVVDERGNERLVAEVRGSTVELRLTTAGLGDGARPTAVLYVTDDRGPRAAALGIGAATGLQLWAEGNAVAELDAWPDDSGSWHPHLHLGGGG